MKIKHKVKCLPINKEVEKLLEEGWEIAKITPHAGFLIIVLERCSYEED